MSRKAQLEQAYRAVCEEIRRASEAAGRATPNLVAVSKYKPAEDIQILYDLGHRHFGENYVQELSEKAAQLPRDIAWHFIGNLQSNKAKLAREIPNLSAIETLDGVSKATKLNSQRAQLPDAAPVSVFIQVNTSDEPQKAGIHADAYDDLVALGKHVVTACPHLKLVGLMTIGSLEQSKHADGENADFTRLAALRERLQPELGVPLGLSMGMSSDYIQAIKQGSTNVRVGSSIFGGRLAKEDVKKN